MHTVLRLGIDTGGTFTDFIWINNAGDLIVHKEPSTPADPSQAILNGLARLGIPPETAIVHGSTVATNALLERRGARTALITTRGFADVLEIGRQNRPDLYALVPTKEPALVPADLRFEVNERLTSRGEVLMELDPAEVDQLVPVLREAGVESVAVCLLFSFLDPAHERLVHARLSDLGGSDEHLHISLSSEILPEYREYERTATTVINAYVAPLMSRYLARLADGVAPRPLAIMQSNGGIIGAELAGAQAARTVLSGPAGGVVGARAIAASAGDPGAHAALITFDMGGTSTDVALCPGRTPMTVESEIAGLPLRLPIIDIHTVGAGGGSLAYVDAGGALHVGPESAGAVPGPACYHSNYADWRERLDANFPAGAATVTDANLVLGRLDAERFLGGAMRLNEAAARSALAHLAAQIQASSIEAAAADVLRVANATMERAMRRISVERGYDPRRFTLLAFGGCGPLHACDLAARMHITSVLIAQTPGVLSAMGMLAAPPSRSYSQTVMQRLSAGGHQGQGWLADQFADLENRARVDLAADGYPADHIDWLHELDMRYLGQSHELSVAWAPRTGADGLVDAFHKAHHRRYGYRQASAAVELVNLRLTATATGPPLRVQAPAPQLRAVHTGREKAVWFEGRPLATPLFNRADLQPGDRFDGPAVITQYDTTTLLPPGWSCLVDAVGNLVLRAART